MSLPHALHFYVPWTAAVMASASEPVTAVAVPPIILHLPGFDLPVLQGVLAVAGVLMARPLARKREAALSMPLFLVVTAVMLVAAVIWVSESRPGILFTFVVSIGLGFSGYSLIETAGDEISQLAKRVIAQAVDALKSIGVGGKSK